MHLRTVGSVLLMVGFAAAATTLLEAARSARPSNVDTILDAPAVPASVLRTVSLGFRSLSADFQYLEAIQVFGDRAYARGNRLERKRHSLAVYQLLDYTTDLDQQFSYAYVFGANAIPVVDEAGVPVNIDETLELLRKGTAHAGENCNQGLPSEMQVNCDWRLPFYLSFLLATYEGDFAAAARAMAEAARRPKHPEYLASLTTRLAAAGGSIDTGIAFAKELEKNAETEDKRAEYEERIRLLIMEKDLRAMEDAATRFAAINGHMPQTLQELVNAELLVTIPIEPHGGHYELDTKTGEIRSTAAARLRLPDSVMREIQQNKERLRSMKKVASP